MTHLLKTYYSPMFDESVIIVHQYSDVDGNPLLHGHVAGTPGGDYIIFRPSELKYQQYGDQVQDWD